MILSCMMKRPSTRVLLPFLEDLKCTGKKPKKGKKEDEEIEEGEKFNQPRDAEGQFASSGGGGGKGYTVVSTDKTMGGFTTEIKSGMTHLASIRKGHFLQVGSEKVRFFSEESAGKTRFHEALKKLGVNEVVSPAGVEKI